MDLGNEDCTPGPAHEVQHFAQGLLKGLCFRGTFVEKRYVSAIRQYRSVIHISSEEKPLIRILEEVKRRINELLGAANPFFWIGFTQSDDQYFLWVNLTQEILGQYLFNIRGFEIDEMEAKVRLRQARPKKESTSPGETSVNDIGTNFMDMTVKPIIKDFANEFGIKLRSTITFTNVKDASSFMIIALIATISGAFYTAKYLLEYSLRFTREFSFLLEKLTPTLLSLIELVKYVIFGFYWVILALFRSPQKPPKNQGHYPPQGRIQYYNGQYTPGRMAIQYRNPESKRRHYQGVEITELPD